MFMLCREHTVVGPNAFKDTCLERCAISIFPQLYTHSLFHAVRFKRFKAGRSPDQIFEVKYDEDSDEEELSWYQVLEALVPAEEDGPQLG
jgi:hypothetical protein